MTVKTVAQIFALAAVLAFVPHTHAQEAKTLNFGIISTESSQNLKQNWQPFLDDMSKKLGVQVNPFFAPDYAGVIEGMRFNKVQLAWHGNKSGMEAVDRANGEVFAQIVYADGTVGYHSLVAVHQDSPYHNIDDVLNNAKNLNFGIGDPNSTSGFTVPGYYIFAQRNIDPKRAFKTVRSANHESNILAVANKQVDAAVFASDTLSKIKKRLPETAAKLRIVWTSPLIPGDPILWHKDLPQDLKTKIKEFFVNYGKTGPDAAREKENLAKLNIGNFQASTNAQLDPIRQLELFKDKVKVEADANMSPAEKKTKLEDITRKLSNIAKSR